MLHRFSSQNFPGQQYYWEAWWLSWGHAKTSLSDWGQVSDWATSGALFSCWSHSAVDFLPCFGSLCCCITQVLLSFKLRTDGVILSWWTGNYLINLVNDNKLSGTFGNKAAPNLVIHIIFPLCTLNVYTVGSINICKCIVVCVLLVWAHCVHLLLWLYWISNTILWQFTYFILQLFFETKNCKWDAFILSGTSIALHSMNVCNGASFHCVCKRKQNLGCERVP